MNYAETSAEKYLLGANALPLNYFYYYWKVLPLILLALKNINFVLLLIL